MKIEYFKYLADIAITQSINQSAERCYISQQSLSRAVKLMEDEFGVELLERTYSGVRLTRAGKLVVENGELILAIMQELNDSLKQIKQNPVRNICGELSINLNGLAIDNMMPSIAENMIIYYPNILLSAEQKLAYDVVKSVYDGNADIGLIGISPETMKAHDDYTVMLNDMHAKKVYEDNVLICLSKKHVLSNRSWLEPKDLLRVPQIGFGFRAPINHVLFKDGIGPKQALQTSNRSLFKKLLQKGMGFGLSNKLDKKLNYSRLERNELAFIPLKCKDDVIIYWLFTKPEQKKTELCQIFFNETKAFIETL